MKKMDENITEIEEITEAVDSEINESDNDKADDTDGNKKKAKKSTVIRRIVAIALILCGLGIATYAIFIPMYNSYINEKRIEEVRNAISGMLRENVMENDPDNYMGTGMTQEEYDSLSVSEKSKIEAQIKKEKAAQKTVADLDIIGIIEIEKLNLTYAIVEGTKNIEIKASIGHLTESSEIGADGTCVLAGHRGGIYGEMFDNIDELEAGDLIVVTDLNGTEYTYEVYEHKSIKAKDWSICDWIDNQITLVLLTCEKSGYGRLCVMCRMVDINEDSEGNQIIDVLKPTTTREPTAIPTVAPTIGPRAPKFHVKIINEFGYVLMDQDTDEQGNWSYDFVEGTYTIIREYSNGDVETETRKIGSGVASKVSKFVITDVNERIVYVGETDEEGNYTLNSADFEPGDYTITFTDVFGVVTEVPLHIDP